MVLIGIQCICLIIYFENIDLYVSNNFISFNIAVFLGSKWLLFKLIQKKLVFINVRFIFAE